MNIRGVSLQQNGIKIDIGKNFQKSVLLDSLAYVTEENRGIFFEDIKNNDEITQFHLKLF